MFFFFTMVFLMLFTLLFTTSYMRVSCTFSPVHQSIQDLFSPYTWSYNFGNIYPWSIQSVIVYKMKLIVWLVLSTPRKHMLVTPPTNCIPTKGGRFLPPISANGDMFILGFTTLFQLSMVHPWLLVTNGYTSINHRLLSILILKHISYIIFTLWY